ncbi:MAG TPA: DUF4097 family beta strand repeat-containing protein [Sphingobacteriaceae bacterium]
MIAVLLGTQSAMAQVPAVPKAPKNLSEKSSIDTEPDLSMKNLDLSMKNLDLQLKNLDLKLKDLELKKLASLESLKSLKSLEKLEALQELNISIPEIKIPEIPDQDPNYQSVEKSKKISKTYTVSAKDKLAIDNQYGKVMINVWSKNEVKVDIEIKAFEGSAEEAQRLLDGVSIDENRSANLINFKTNIQRKPQGGWWGIKRHKDGKEERRGVWIDYIVYMPAKNPLDVSNSYGSTILPDFDGPVNINSTYGSLVAENLHHAANVVKVKYGSAKIGSFSMGNLNVSYGSLKLDEANKINAEVSYGSTRIGKVLTGGDLDCKYGGLKIDMVDKNVKTLMINADKGSVTLGVDQAANFNFDVTTHMGGFDYPENRVKLTSSTPSTKERHGPQLTKNYKGQFGKGSSSRVIIKTNMGSVKFL